MVQERIVTFNFLQLFQAAGADAHVRLCILSAGNRMAAG